LGIGRDIVVIRNVRPDQHDAWLLLRGLLWPDHPREELQREQEQILGAPHRNSVLVAALPNEELIGFVEVSLRDWAEGCTTGPVGYIEGWYVQLAHRRSGVGRKLIEAAEGWAISHNCTEMASDAELWNDVSQLAHEALGYSEATRLVCFSKTLGKRKADA
jgi:aminoglycoside 6'-N-acetyltransferase I